MQYAITLEVKYKLVNCKWQSDMQKHPDESEMLQQYPFCDSLSVKWEVNMNCKIVHWNPANILNRYV